MNQQHNSRTNWFGWFSGLSAIASISTLIVLKIQSPQVQAENVIDSPPQRSETIRYETLALPRSLVHIVRIPATASATITPTVAQGLESLDTLAKKQVPTAKGSSTIIAMINGGFFDPNNQQTTSFMIKDGTLVLDPRTNSRLIDNPSLARYMPQILNRSEFRRYQCNSEQGDGVQYAIAPHQKSPPPQCRIVDALGAGPALLPDFRGEAEAFLDPANRRDALGSNVPNARSAIGVTDTGTVLLIMAAQREDVNGPSGLSLFELAEVMKSLGITSGLNLDGGSSSSLYYEGTTYYGRLDADKNAIKRPVKSAITVLDTK